MRAIDLVGLTGPWTWLEFGHASLASHDLTDKKNAPPIQITRGEIYFDHTQDAVKRIAMDKERQELEKADVNRAPGSGGAPPRVPTERIKTHLDDADGGNH